MPRSPRSSRIGALVLLAGALGCGSGQNGGRDQDAARSDAGSPIVRCSMADDPDHDLISSTDEDGYDLDGDGVDDIDVDGDHVPNDTDTDSDGDGLSDAMESGRSDCTARPRDLDGDGVPDFLDTDANGDRVPDASETGDADGDGVVDALDADVDGDGIANGVECGDAAACVDTDHDGMPDYLDDDSDADTIADRNEGAGDVDRDMSPNFRDLDSDGDTIEDAVEAGDGNLATPPVQCMNEIDATTFDSAHPTLLADGLDDFVDVDSDNDGLGDGDELRVGTSPCDADSDDDGYGDLAEGAYVITNCPDGTSGTDCGCAHSSSCGIPAGDFFVVLPYRGTPVDRDLDFGTTVRVADVFFVSDTTGSMGQTLTNVARTVSTPVTGIIDRIVETIPDAWVGGGGHGDMPFPPYDSAPDEPFHLAIRMTPPDHAEDVRTAFGLLTANFGGDGPEAGTMALHQILSGEGGTWSGPSPSPTYTMHRYAGDCLDVGWGAPCFRERAMPIIIHFSDICQHNGPTGDCDDYVGITPSPPSWIDTMTEMSTHGARYVGINASGQAACSTVHAPAGCSGPPGSCLGSPCWFMTSTAQSTGSVDIDGNTLVYDLPNAGTSDTLFADTIVEAIDTVATRVPFDVTTRLRDDTTDPERFDATRFVFRRTPACNVGVTPCWTEPTGVTHDQAVVAYDLSTFYGVVPGTRVVFRITFRNDVFPGEPHIVLFKAFIDVTSGGTAVLDTRQVYIVIPAATVPFG